MKIIHIHPSSKMGNIFVKPLIDFEKSIEWLNKYETNKLKIDTDWLGDGNTSDLVINGLKKYFD